MVPFVGGDDGDGDVLGPGLPPSTSAEGEKGLPGPQRHDLHLQSCLRT